MLGHKKEKKIHQFSVRIHMEWRSGIRWLAKSEASSSPTCDATKECYFLYSHRQQTLTIQKHSGRGEKKNGEGRGRNQGINYWLISTFKNKTVFRNSFIMKLKAILNNSINSLMKKKKKKLNWIHKCGSKRPWPDM